MLTALAPSGPVAPVVPTSPPSTTGTPQSAQRESFQDVYGNVSSEDDSKNDAGTKQKTSDSGDTKPAKKTTSDDGNNKTAVAAAPSPHGFVLQKAPLGFVFLGQELAPQQAADGSVSLNDNQVQSGADATMRSGVPNFGLPLAKPAQIAAAALAPADEKLAFSARLTQPDAAKSAVQAPRVSSPQMIRPQTANEARTMAGPDAGSAAKDAYQTVDLKKATAMETVVPARETASATAFDLRPSAAPPQPAEPGNTSTSRSFAIQDVQPTLAEIPRPPASTEILLQLAGNNQSTASVRVVDRSGTVNVTVHAADADLRNSLRSNLGDLASQLTGQGFKTEVVKPAVIAANADNQHDTRHGSQNSSSQQHNQLAQDSRQPQRDRRANSERWRDELEQETSGSPGTPGGKS